MNKLARLIVLALSITIPLTAIYLFLSAPVQTAKGKSPVRPIIQEMSAVDQAAQDVALSDGRILQAMAGNRSEVLSVKKTVGYYPSLAVNCSADRCRQIEIYNFDDDETITAIVDVRQKKVLQLLRQPNIQPGINARLAQQAVNIVVNDAQVEKALGISPRDYPSDLIPMDADLLGSSCDGSHLCAAVTFKRGNQILWAVADLTMGQLAGIAWTTIPSVENEFAPAQSGGCPTPGTIMREGWSVDYAVADSDGLIASNVSYNGVLAAKKISLLEWHADYGLVGFRDSTGCGGLVSGFPIAPYGATVVTDVLDGNSNVIGFEIYQDFRMENWGDNCNYRYAQRYQFFNDGRFRVVAGAYGKGCGIPLTYRPIVRLDLDVVDAGNDHFSYWQNGDWITLTAELYRTPTAGANGAHQYTPDGYAWRLLDNSGSGYYIEPDVGQFEDGDGGHSDDPFVFVTQHDPAEGDSDMPLIGACCYDDHRQGPDQYVNGESIAGQNNVLWYVPQMETITETNNYYCWTVSGEPQNPGDPPPETYPCFAGPMFVPFTASVEFLAPDFSWQPDPANIFQPVQFQNWTTGTGAIDYAWDFGDGIGNSFAISPTYTYSAGGAHTIWLTATNSIGSQLISKTLQIVPAGQLYLPIIAKP